MKRVLSSRVFFEFFNETHFAFAITDQLMVFSRNIMEGMDYMANQGIIHRDLAARNVLVADEDTVKISDFGLARLKTEDKEYYRMNANPNVSIPVKWMAIESLTESRCLLFRFKTEPILNYDFTISRVNMTFSHILILMVI